MTTTHELLPRIENTMIGSVQTDCVNARDLYDYLELGRDFTNWFKDQIDSLDLQPHIDFEMFMPNEKGELATTWENPHPKTDYALTLDIAKHIALASRTPKGRELRQYFIDYEKKLSRMTPTEIVLWSAQQLVEQERTIKKLQARVDYEERQVRNVERIQTIEWKKRHEIEHTLKEHTQQLDELTHTEDEDWIFVDHYINKFHPQMRPHKRKPGVEAHDKDTEKIIAKVYSQWIKDQNMLEQEGLVPRYKERGGYLVPVYPVWFLQKYDRAFNDSYREK